MLHPGAHWLVQDFKARSAALTTLLHEQTTALTFTFTPRLLPAAVKGSLYMQVA
jgi:hypothetical protein